LFAPAEPGVGVDADPGHKRGAQKFRRLAEGLVLSAFSTASMYVIRARGQVIALAILIFNFE
jgi:hypothetical protein